MTSRIKHSDPKMVANGIEQALRLGYELVNQGSSYINRDTLQYWAIIQKQH